jgi:hypothetical protein
LRLFPADAMLPFNVSALLRTKFEAHSDI